MRVAVLGAGQWGRLHAHKLAAMDGVDVCGVVDPNLERARSVAASLTNCLPVAAFSELSLPVDAAIVAVSMEALYATALEVLERRVHVLVEKPVGMDLQQGVTLQKIAAAQNRVLGVGYLERFNPGLAQHQGATDSVLAYRAGTGTPRCGPALLDWTVHDIDLAFHLLGPGLAFERKKVFHGGFGIGLSSDDGRRARLVTRTSAKRPRRTVVTSEGRLELGGQHIDLLGAELNAFIGGVRGEPLGALATGRDACAVLGVIEEAQRLHHAA